MKYPLLLIDILKFENYINFELKKKIIELLKSVETTIKYMNKNTEGLDENLETLYDLDQICNDNNGKEKYTEICKEKSNCSVSYICKRSSGKCKPRGIIKNKKKTEAKRTLRGLDLSNIQILLS